MKGTDEKQVSKHIAQIYRQEEVGIFQDRVALKSYNSIWAREMAQCIKDLVL